MVLFSGDGAGVADDEGEERRENINNLKTIQLFHNLQVLGTIIKIWGLK